MIPTGRLRTPADEAAPPSGMSAEPGEAPCSSIPGPERRYQIKTLGLSVYHNSTWSLWVWCIDVQALQTGRACICLVIRGLGLPPEVY